MHPSTSDAATILIDAADSISNRAAVRDQPTGERSMARTVAAFNAIYGVRLTEEQGWQFMALLKMARSSAGRTHLDDYTDQAGYSALAGECAARVLSLGELPHSFNRDDAAQARCETLAQLERVEALARENTARDNANAKAYAPT